MVAQLKNLPWCLIGAGAARRGGGLPRALRSAAAPSGPSVDAVRAEGRAL